MSASAAGNADRGSADRGSADRAAPTGTAPTGASAGSASRGSGWCRRRSVSVVVLTTSTLNRVMVVELALPAIAARAAGGAALRGPGAAAAAGAWLGCGRPAHAVDRRRHGAARRRRARRGRGDRLDGHAPPGRTRAGGAGVCADRRRRRRVGHLAAGAAGQAHRAVAPRRGGDGGLDHDDRRLRRHRDRRGPAARSVLARPAGRRRGRRRGAGAAAGGARGGGHRGQRHRGARVHPRRCQLRPGAGGCLGRAAVAPLRAVRVRLDAGLQRAGAGAGAVRRAGVPPDARPVGAADRDAAWRGAGRHAARGGGGQHVPRPRARRDAQLDDRRLRRLGGGAAGARRGRR